MMTGVAAAMAALTLTFVTHASFFSTETKQPVPLDPQVFAKDASAVAATGPQGIAHVAGFRPARLSDSKGTPLFNAQGKALGFTLRLWLGATGTGNVAPASNDGQTVTVHFAGLVPHGVYSLFENHFDQQPVGFTPLDGAGTANTFVADARGAASLTMTVKPAMTPANAILLVYHSDRKAHGMSRGTIGVTAHHQLIAPMPRPTTHNSGM